MNAEEQEQIARLVAKAFDAVGIAVEEPVPSEMGSGTRRWGFRPVEGAAWLKLVAWLTRSGYRLTIHSGTKDE